MLKKGLVVVVIFLFIGIAFAPSINANVSKSSLDKETVEFTTEVCGLNGGKQTVKLTQEEAEEVEQLFDSIRERLNNTETREETEEIFKDAVVGLDRYGLLGGLSVEQAQRLVTGGYQNSRVMKVLDRIPNRYRTNSDGEENYLCLIAGKSDTTWFVGPLSIYSQIRAIYTCCICGLIAMVIADILNIPWWEIELPLLRNLYENAIYRFLKFDSFHNCQNPLSVGNYILIGQGFDNCRHPANRTGIHPANGWIFTLGLKGIKRWNGSFSGGTYEPNPLMILVYLLSWAFFFYFSIFEYNLGVIGFTGLKTHIKGDVENSEFSYLGTALLVNIEQN